MTEPWRLTPEEIKFIEDRLRFVMESTGYGEVNIVVKDNRKRFLHVAQHHDWFKLVSSNQDSEASR